MKTINVSEKTKEKFNSYKLKTSANLNKMLTDDEFVSLLLDFREDEDEKNKIN